MTNTPVVSIVIRCKNEAAYLGAVLDAVLGQQGTPAFEILALDSGSSDGTLPLLRARPVQLIELPASTFTFGRALNLGAREARGALVVYLSAHCRPMGASWLARLVAPLTEPTVAATFGRQLPIPGVNALEALTQERLFPAAPPAGVIFSNANAAVRRTTVLQHPFDEVIPAAEDHLWASTLDPGARIVYVADAPVYHSHAMSFAEWRYRFFINGLAEAYLQSHGVRLPWEGAASAREIARTRRGALARLAVTLAGRRAWGALVRLPAYAVARTFWYARGVRQGRRRYHTGTPA